MEPDPRKTLFGEHYLRRIFHMLTQGSLRIFKAPIIFIVMLQMECRLRRLLRGVEQWIASLVEALFL